MKYLDCERFTDDFSSADVPFEMSLDLLVDYIEEAAVGVDHYFWFNIANFLDLSEDFINCYLDCFKRDDADFESVLENQKISEEFLLDNIDYIENIFKDDPVFVKYFKDNSKIPEDVKDRFLSLLEVRK